MSNLQFRSTISRKSFSLDDVVEDCPLLKVEFCNDFNEKIKPDLKLKVARKMLEYGLKVLAEETAGETHRYDPREGF